jgi:hypothetical protein
MRYNFAEGASVIGDIQRRFTSAKPYLASNIDGRLATCRPA